MRDWEPSAFGRDWRWMVAGAITGLVMFASATPALATGTTVCKPSTGQVNGIDVSVYNETIDYSEVAAARYKFVYARATYGTSTDSDYAANRSGAENAGLEFGAYDLFDPTQNPVTQADDFLSVAAPTDGELVPMLDVETSDTNLTPTEYAAAVKSWLDTVKQALGVQPLVYTSNSQWDSNDGGLNDDTTVSAAGYPLWIGDYSGTLCATIPSAWSTWVIWQTADDGTVPGITGTVDLDDFNASASAGSLTPFTVGHESLPANTLAPAITPTKATVGQALSCSQGTWTGTSNTYTYAWLRDGNVIGGQDQASYKVGINDAGHTLTCQVTATFNGQSTTATSTGLSIPAPAPPKPSIGGNSGGSGTPAPITAPPGTTAPVTVGCNGVAGQTCSGTLSAASKETTVNGNPVSVGPVTTNVRATVKEVVIATESYTVAAGGTETVNMTLNATGRALLARFYKLPATLELPGGSSVGLTYMYRVVTASISSGFKTGARGGTRVSRLLLTGLPAHASINGFCQGGGCPFQSRAFTAHGTRLNLASVFAHHTLAPEATLEFFIAVKGEVAKVFSFRMRRSKRPLATRLCQAPGAASPATCAA